MITAYNIKNHTWRDQYNPLRGLSLPKLVSLLGAGERGAYADLQWFYHYMERSDAMIHAVIQRRRAALLSGLFQEQFDTPLLREYFPDQPILAYFEFAPPAADEVSRVVKDAVELAKAGVRLDLRELEEKTGYKLSGQHAVGRGEKSQ